MKESGKPGRLQMRARRRDRRRRESGEMDLQWDCTNSGQQGEEKTVTGKRHQATVFTRVVPNLDSSSFMLISSTVLYEWGYLYGGPFQLGVS